VATPFTEAKKDTLEIGDQDFPEFFQFEFEGIGRSAESGVGKARIDPPEMVQSLLGGAQDILFDIDAARECASFAPLCNEFVCGLLASPFVSGPQSDPCAGFSQAAGDPESNASVSTCHHRHSTGEVERISAHLRHAVVSLDVKASFGRLGQGA